MVNWHSPQASISDLRQAFAILRQRTLGLFASIDPDQFRTQAHPDFSPMGWHLGHIGWTEGLWLLPSPTRRALTPPEFDALFAADGLPKAERTELPSLPELVHYLDAIRGAVLEQFEHRLQGNSAWLGWWLLQHEAQHGETIQIVQALQAPRDFSVTIPVDKSSTPQITIPRGWVIPPTDSPLLLDNEKPGVSVEVPAFAWDQHPVTAGQFQYFIESGGYQLSEWWPEAGWAWIKENSIEQPRYWPVKPNAVVFGVSWYEAAAYAKFVGKALPTERQWERARQYLELALNHDPVNQVWEWTDTWFHPYPGFCSFPYPGYSASYFDQAHRVLKGGSIASHPLTQRPSFRNWYAPETREIFAGIRCIQSL